MDSYSGTLYCDLVPLRDTLRGQQPEMHCLMMWRTNRSFYSFWVRDSENRKALCTLCNGVLCVKSEYLNFAKVRETQNKHCARYSKPLCCCCKGSLTFGGQEDWDLTQEEMSWSHLCFKESASSMQLLLLLCVDNCILAKGFSLYRE